MEKYHITTPEKDGSFYLTFWLFGEGYKEEGKYDRLCFDDMQTPDIRDFHFVISHIPVAIAGSGIDA